MSEFEQDDVSDGEVHMANKILELNEEYEKYGLSDKERIRAVAVAKKFLEESYEIDI